ncbi:hypothetical protein GON09_005682 [Rhodococcus sp. B50]|nr:hypothetical protein [Rhodococcus sp. B50]
MRTDAALSPALPRSGRGRGSLRSPSGAAARLGGSPSRCRRRASLRSARDTYLCAPTFFIVHLNATPESIDRPGRAARRTHHRRAAMTPSDISSHHTTSEDNARQRNTPHYQSRYTPSTELDSVRTVMRITTGETMDTNRTTKPLCHKRFKTRNSTQPHPTRSTAPLDDHPPRLPPTGPETEPDDRSREAAIGEHHPTPAAQHTTINHCA